MRPGALSIAGFLGKDESLAAVMAADELAIEGAGLTFEMVAIALESLITAAARSPTYATTVKGIWDVRVQLYQGFQVCPWSPDPRHAQPCMAEATGLIHSSIDWHIANLHTNQEQAGPGFIVHLMHDHHFCEGLESPYRVDPLSLAQLLRLV